MDHRDKLLKLVQEKGPLLPSAINKELDTNVLFASAMLSEMVDTKKLRLTNLKIGGSPLYYAPGQEEQLEEFSHKLNEKDKRTFELIRKEKILRDKDQEPLTRVSLREIKDFAIPLQVTVNDTKELFWKYYMISDENAHGLIQEFLESRNFLQPEQPKKAVQKTMEVEVEKRPAPAFNQEPQKKTDQEIEREPENEIQKEIQKENQKETIKEPAYSFSYSFSETTTKTRTRDESKEETKVATRPKENDIPEDDDFYQKVTGFFKENQIQVEEFNLIRKGSEMDFIVKIPSPVGPLRYFCKARSKKKMADGDVSSAFVAGQMKQLPVLFLIDGELTQKAIEMAEKELKSFVVKKL